MDIPKDGTLLRQGSFSHTEGYGTTADGFAAHAEGYVTSAGVSNTQGVGAHSEGMLTTAQNNASHAEGYNTSSTGYAGHTEGYQTAAAGTAGHAEGYLSSSSGNYSHAEGQDTMAGGTASHAEGLNTTASGDGAHAEGVIDATDTTFVIKALARGSHAEGIGTTAGVDNATGIGAHAEGYHTVASGDFSHAEGEITTASGEASHAEGGDTTASGTFSHAEGVATNATGNFSHAEGNVTVASGLYSHAEGSQTTASGDNSHTEGLLTNAGGFEGAHIIGQFGQATNPYSWFLANGTDAINVGIGAKIIGNDPLQPGVTNAYIDGAWIGGGADYAEMFETVDGQSIEPGYFVTLDGEKTRVAHANDDFVLGVTSVNYTVLGNSGELRWKGKYLTDEWGRVLRREVVVPAVTGEDGHVIRPERKVVQPVLNPAWDNTQKYISRLLRPEWVAVGLIGKVLVRDDGTSQANGYCTVTDSGAATTAANGYRVLKRTGDRQILILFK
ncbi:Hypothetical protein LUCI_3807 [Lucifera butyrica]|uniref:Peptidase G2 IMC autoproteolytic cleavage domain-containing protein n=1 Tax=Lucifera butyrica TaxID=1351585 RepID=A0A498RBB4_9FIRM|nr:peptidase G2 autoproteolytic cleavage domain-containing protein [Lucifera butyrica]VBB08529.1 Hypothetical protein LUCI_3807 [Lucifera butyrica]